MRLKFKGHNKLHNFNTTPSKEQNAIQNKRILIVDSDMKSRHLLSIVLKKLGATVDEANTGVEAFELLQKNAYGKASQIEIVIMGIDMPQMNGINLLRLVRDHNLLKNISVFVMSHPHEERSLHECRVLGITDNLKKPLKVADAISKIVRDINKRKKTIEKTPSNRVEYKGEYSDKGFPIEFQNIPKRDTYPLITSFYKCPFCNTTFTAPKVKDKSLQPDPEDNLQIGLYLNNTGEYENIIPVLIDTISCPECLWTADRDGFLKIWNRDNAKFYEIENIPRERWEYPAYSFTPHLIADFRLFERKRIEMAHKAADIGEALFTISRTDRKIPRSFADAQISLNLALYCMDYMIAHSHIAARSALRHKCAEYYIKKQYIYNLMLERLVKNKNKKELIAYRLDAIIKGMELMLKVKSSELPTLQTECLFLRQKFFLSNMLSNILQKKEQKARVLAHKEVACNHLQKKFEDAEKNQNTIELNIIAEHFDPVINYLSKTDFNLL